MLVRAVAEDQAEISWLKLESIVEDVADRGTRVGRSDASSAIAEFLALCADSLAPQPGSRRPYSDDFREARDAFVRAGRDALAARPWRAEHEWLQAGVHPSQDAMPSKELYERVATFVRGLLRTSLIDDFFFMHKPPGMRLRFRMRPTTRAALADVVASETTRWRENGLIDHVESAVYEPESLLFGGPQAMPFVHALFTVDSLLWLDYHASDLGDSAIRSPSWLVSLAVLRTVFAGLDITGWEDLGVWDCVRRAAGRQLGDAKASTPLYDEVAGQLRNAWSRREDLAGGLDPVSQAIVARHDAALQTGAARWRSGYFLDPRASLGPRTAAAFYVVFHWNRGALTQAQQALLAESLAERMNADGHG